MSSAEHEIESGERFAFGRNWSAFLSTVSEDRIQAAEKSLSSLLHLDSLHGKSFLDLGSGSGLFSLAARRLGAKVTSIDFDAASVQCTTTLRDRYDSGDSSWTISQGSVLDVEFLRTLGRFDVVYSWGVLHHTGNMWQALATAADCVNAGGLLALAIYNDQGPISRFWLKVKQLYCSSGIGRLLVCLVFIPYFFVRTVLVSLIRRQNLFRTYRSERGMSLWHDWQDWLGGLPFEVARAENIFLFCRARGFVLENLITTNNLGCNQFVFRRG